MTFRQSSWIAALVSLLALGGRADPAPPIPDRPFAQEVARAVALPAGMQPADVQWVEPVAGGRARMLAKGAWYEATPEGWRALPGLAAGRADEFVFPGADGAPLRVALPWADVTQWVRGRDGRTHWIVTRKDPYRVFDGVLQSMGWPSRWEVRQIAVSPAGEVWVASSGGLLRQRPDGWGMVGIADGRGRGWAVNDVRGVAFDATGRLWVAVPAGVISGDGENWTFYEGRDGLPYADFTGVSAGGDGSVWFGTRKGAVRFDGSHWAYRQGRRWLPGDDVRALAVGAEGQAWVVTGGGVGVLERRSMTLADKAVHYEDEIERCLLRTPLGYLSEVGLGAPGDRSKIVYSDSDNDGLWTAMYGAGECFAYAATRRPEFRARAKKVFEALRFLQKVTQGGPHSPPKGFVARTIRPVEWPDPNVGRLEADRRDRENGDRLWKVYEPRWPKSADGRWYWKSDTSSDELDGHYFFYARYYDLVADDAEKERVREVVRDLTDHLVNHDFCLVDHDGTPTRWGRFGPKDLNGNPDWWVERGLNSLSMLSYLAVAHHVTGEARFLEASRRLIADHGYAVNVMNPKTQTGMGSGNHSDDEMGFMCFYNLLSYTTETVWRPKWLYAFHAYAALENPEMNPFFHFAYAAFGRGRTYRNPWGEFPIEPWSGWLDDSLATLRGFPLDRCNWAHQNSHRLDLVRLAPQQSVDIYEPRTAGRGHRVNGKVLPVEERHFNHWNTDPWRLDYGGDGRELASGTVYLLPYYMGLHHGFIAPASATETR